jgi:hypothetical protein
MNENARAWVAALRSSDYTQGFGQLRSPNGRFCCLGVACDLHARATGKGWELADKTMYITRGDRLPREVMRWLGLRTDDGTYLSSARRHSLMKDNDEIKHDFREIADIIELEPERLFAPPTWRKPDADDERIEVEHAAELLGELVAA